MASRLRVILEIGRKRKIVAGAMDWPGLDRWGTSEEDALQKLRAYLARYVGVAERAGLADAFATARDVEVVERVPGSSSTDFWGVAHVPSEIEREVLSSADLERRLDLLKACWSYFDDVASRVSEELVKGPRGGGRSRDEIIRHVYASERHNWWRKVGLREDDGVRLTPAQLATLRRNTSTGSAPTTPRGNRLAPGRSNFSFAAPRSTRWITLGRWRTETSAQTESRSRATQSPPGCSEPARRARG